MRTLCFIITALFVGSFLAIFFILGRNGRF